MGRIMDAAAFLANNVADTGRDGKQQQVHVDHAVVPARRVVRPPPVIITALQAGSVLVYPFSHLMVSALGWMMARTANEKAADRSLASKVPAMDAIRIHMEPGQVLVMDGHLVHAGDRGQPGQPALRLHFYMQHPADQAQHPYDANMTYVLSALGNDIVSNHFTARFGQTR
jgi:ectoine hydroxylase-related dioxygenase (phytanoyl-CoA dioxygenase family)